MAEQRSTISAEQLSALTGLTDRRHRQLADDGFFPKPEGGEYLFGPTIRGLLRFYREARERATNDLAGEKLTKLRTERMIAETKLELARGRLIDIETVGDFISRTAARWEQLLKLKLETEGPTRLVGKDVVGVRRELRAMHDEIRELSNVGLDEWKPEQK